MTIIENEEKLVSLVKPSWSSCELRFLIRIFENLSFEDVVKNCCGVCQLWNRAAKRTFVFKISNPKKTPSSRKFFEVLQRFPRASHCPDHLYLKNLSQNDFFGVSISWRFAVGEEEEWRTKFSQSMPLTLAEIQESWPLMRNVTVAPASGRAIRNLNGLSSLKLITTLSIPNAKQLTDISALVSLKNLTRLVFCFCESPKTLATISELTTLVHLDIFGCNALDLSFITPQHYLLQNLLISNLRIKEVCLASFSRPAALKNLNLSFSSKVTRLALPKSVLQHLKYCDLTGCSKLKELENFNYCRKLRHFSWANAKDISFLRNCIDLRSLELRRCSLSSIGEDLQRLTLLTHVDVSGIESEKSFITTSGFLRCCRFLKELNCEYSSISSLRFLNYINDSESKDGQFDSYNSSNNNNSNYDHNNCSNRDNNDTTNNNSNIKSNKNNEQITLTRTTTITNNVNTCNIEILNISHTLCTSITGLYNCKNLISLTMDSLPAAFVDLSPLSHCVKLQHLSCSNCPGIVCIDGLASCVNLKLLNIARNVNLTDIEEIGCCIQLKEINFDGCKKVEDITSLSSCTNLLKLHLADTNVENISSLVHCFQLKELTLRNTNVTDISCLSHCPSLIRLVLANTRVTDVSMLNPHIQFIHF